MQQNIPVLQSKNAAATLQQQHACPFLGKSRNTAASLEQTHAARLQLATLPGSSVDAPASVGQAQLQSSNKVLELLQTSFAQGPKLGSKPTGNAGFGVLLTDPM